jgi:phage shock protein A
MTLSEVIREWLSSPVLTAQRDLASAVINLANKVEEAVATVEEALAQIQAEVADVKVALQLASDRVAEDVANLKAQIEAGTQITSEQLDPILSGLNEIKTSADNLDPVPPQETP